MIPRFFCPIPLRPGATVDLPVEAAHHALKVLRIGAGEKVILFDGQGGQWQAVLKIEGKSLRATLGGFDATDHEPPLAVTLVQALPGGDKMDWVVQKAVELGVHRIQPVSARRCLVRLKGEREARRLEHWHKVAIAACEQSGRNRLPGIAPLLDLPHFLAQPTADNELRFICAPGAAQRLREWSVSAAPPRSISLLIGPEGGFEEGELAAAKAAGFKHLSLGPRVLRTETAGLAALAAIMALWGDI